MIPQSRTYDVLESLTTKGFAQATPSSPRAYIPVPPARSLTSFYDSKRKEIQGRAAKIQEEAQLKLEAIQDAYKGLVRDFPAAPHRDGVRGDQVTVLQGRENIEGALIGLIKEARSHILRITKPPAPNSKQPVDPFYIVGMENQKFVYDAIERKIDMRWLSLAREIPTFLGLDIGDQPERRYFERDEDISEKFLLVDSSSALLNLRDPLTMSYGYVALAIQSEAVASMFLEHFEKMWRRGTPLEKVLPRVKELTESVCAALGESGLGKTEVSAYRTLARLGAVDQDLLVAELTKRKVRPQEATAACDRLVRLGLIHRERSLRALLVEHPANVKTLIGKGKLKL